MDQVPERRSLDDGTGGRLEDVQLLLDTRLVARAREMGSDLSRTVNQALEMHVRRQDRCMSDQDIVQVIAALNKFHEQYGFLSDEFSTL